MDSGKTPALSRWLAVALVLHGGAIVAASAQRALAPSQVDAREPMPLEIEVTQVPEEPPSTPPSPESTPSALEERATTMPASQSSSSQRESATGNAFDDRAGESAGVGEIVTAPDATGSGGWSFRITRGPDVLARGQVPVAVDRSAVRAAEHAAESEGAYHSRTGGIAEALAEADVARGLGHGGPAVSALEEVARSENAPVRGVATFDVLIEPGGKIDVHLASADTEYDAWSRLTNAMAEAVAKKNVRMPSGARGLRVVVQLDARVQWPDGRDPGSAGAFAHTTGLSASEGSIVPKSVPAVNAGVVGKVCSAGVHVGLDGPAINGGCSLENIGATPIRVVHGREIREVPM